MKKSSCKFVLSLILLFMSVQLVKSQDESEIIYNPIGYFHTDYSPQKKAPRQGSLKPEQKATIEILPEYREALKDLDSNEYIIVLYHLNKSKGWEVTVHPGGIKTNKALGMFATRTPRRPNPIGFGVIKLDKIEGGTIYVSGVDAFNGTPVLDIKPFIPSIDCPGNKTGKEEKRFGL
ncbi:tRNA (N6-threonylcarbamoyladenosine(37)-N6)-methyltransferase TrmO [Draconibacterium sp.]|nr:tRNA (N6-threonylcarbamoyladenosine(37)-N6)-methyltransferase TrmO [Draconibacterium sp.]